MIAHSNERRSPLERRRRFLRRAALASGCAALAAALLTCQNPASGGVSGGTSGAGAPGSQTPRFLYVTNYSSTNGTGGLSSYALTAGAPAALSGSPASTGSAGRPYAVAVSPDGSYLYVTNSGSATGAGGLSAYSLAGGVPTALSGSPFATGSAGDPRGIAISPDGKYLYVTNLGSSAGTGGLSVFSLSAGVPTALSGSPYDTGSAGSPFGVAVSPDGNYLYVTNSGSTTGAGGLSVYSLAGGVPTALSGATGSAGHPRDVAVSPDGKVLYVTNGGSTDGAGGLSVYSLTGGVPAALSGSPYATGSAGSPWGVAVSPDGNYLYVTNSGSATGAGGLSVYSLAGGVPTALSGSPFATGSAGYPSEVAVSSDGRYLYVTNNGGSGGTGGLSAYALSGGVPSQLSGSPYATGSAGGAFGLAVNP